MLAKEIMSAPVITVQPDATVGEAVNLMLSHHISCLLVVDDRQKLVGILTHTDFGLHQRYLPLVDNLYTVLGAWATPKTLEEASLKVANRLVKDVMTRNVTTIKADSSVGEVVELMLRVRVHRIPVMDGEKIVGIITRHDLLKLMVTATSTTTE